MKKQIVASLIALSLLTTPNFAHAGSKNEKSITCPNKKFTAEPLTETKKGEMMEIAYQALRTIGLENRIFKVVGAVKQKDTTIVFFQNDIYFISNSSEEGKLKNGGIFSVRHVEFFFFSEYFKDKDGNMIDRFSKIFENKKTGEMWAFSENGIVVAIVRAKDSSELNVYTCLPQELGFKAEDIEFLEDRRVRVYGRDDSGKCDSILVSY